MKFPKIKIPKVDANDGVITAGFIGLFAGLCFIKLWIALVVVGGLLIAYGVMTELLEIVIVRRPK